MFDIEPGDLGPSIRSRRAMCADYNKVNSSSFRCRPQPPTTWYCAPHCVILCQNAGSHGLMGPREQLLGLIQQLYAAPGCHEGWHAFLEDVCGAMNGSGASFISLNLQSVHHASVAMTVRTDPAALRAYHDHWGAFDPWACSPRLSELGSEGVIIGDGLISHVQFRRTAFYADFGRPYDIVRCIAGMIESGPQVFSVISINGTERRGAFGAAESALLNALMPHLRRALQLHRRLVSAETISHDLAGAIDRARHAVLLVTAAGRVTFMNSAAERLVATRDVLTVDGGELRAAGADDTARLRSLLADAAATSMGRGVGAGGALALGRPSGRRPLMAFVSPLPGRKVLFPTSDPATAMVVVTDPERGEIPDADVLGTLLGLTPAEAKLTRLLAEGFTIKDAAAGLDLRTETVRTRVKTIFEKTSTHSQAALGRLALSLTTRL